jgi:hypothetical protein
MRTYGFPGFTHTVKLNPHGDYEVTWARGFDRKSYSMGKMLPNVVFTEEEVRKNVAGCLWYVVEDTPAQKEMSASMPDEFIASNTFSRSSWSMKKDGATWRAYCLEGGTLLSINYYSEDDVRNYIKKGTWTIQERVALTAEQQRALKEFKEQVAQLDQSIKLNEQDIAHKEHLIGNYRQRQDDLRKKIEELEGK